MIDGYNTMSRVAAMMPPEAMQAVTLLSRKAGESGHDEFPFAHAHVRRATRDEITRVNGNMSKRWRRISLYRQSETAKPKIGDAIRDSDGVIWQIRGLHEKMMGWCFDCLVCENA